MIPDPDHETVCTEKLNVKYNVGIHTLNVGTLIENGKLENKIKNEMVRLNDKIFNNMKCDG